MPTIVEQTPDIRSSVPSFVSLIAVPVIALTLMAALALQQDGPRSAPALRQDVSMSSPAPGTAAGLSQQDHGDYALYILDNAQVAQGLSHLNGRGPLLDWYAFVSTPDEEADLMKAWDEANWIRIAAGLPMIRVVDLRL